MVSIRTGVYETNSSSCHSFSIVKDESKIKDFIEGKRLYFEIDNIQDFYTIKEIVDYFIITKNSDEFKDLDNESWGSNFIESRVDYKDREDFNRMKNYISKNISEDMIRFAFTDYESDNFPAKTPIKSFLQNWAEYCCYCPLLSFNDFKGDYFSFRPENFMMSDEGLFTEEKTLTGEFYDY